MSPIRVLIVEDSAVVREHLRRIISADGRFEVAGLAASGEEAIALVERVAPDVITMDIQMPGMQGFEATRRIMALRPTPIVVVSGIGSKEVDLTMQVLKAGALAVVEKPVATTHQDYDAMASRLCTQLAIMSEVKVVRQRPVVPRLARDGSHLLPGNASSYRALAITASTGGPSALLQLFTGLGRNFPLPIAVVQHMTPNFMEGFASWLAGVVPLPIEIVRQRVPLLPGRVYLAPSDHHLAVQGTWADLDDRPPVGNHRPSGNVLFSSMARSLGSAGLGLLLTGMGEDGAAGLRELRTAGGFTIAEDESSAVVYGMPAAGVRLGAVCESLPLNQIAGRILEVASSTEARTAGPEGD
jgi:two-component system, chemotaxis family, protein-glutamate methylesterase/glutaminase